MKPPYQVCRRPNLDDLPRIIPLDPPSREAALIELRSKGWSVFELPEPGKKSND